MTYTFKNLEDDYSRIEEIRAEFNKAEAEENNEGMEKARADYKAVCDEIYNRGSEYNAMMRLYDTMKEKKNSLLDINEPSQYRDEAELIARFKSYGVKQFTFSSGWSSANESAWAFIQAGAKLEGMVEINERYNHWEKKQETVPAYLFSVQ